jgi:glutathione S-transferase
MKPITLYGHWGAPNPWKVRLILDTLSLPYDCHLLEFNETKTPSYLALTPNGRLPCIVDPNTDITLWESGAIILYLIDQYDKDQKISYGDGPNKYLCQQWLMFQVSGQGPYFGQATWFGRFHPEKVPSAVDRYVNEIERVTGVLNKALEGKEWIVGEKCTYADLAFVTWAGVGKGLMLQLGKGDVLEKYGNYGRWMKKMEEMQMVKDANAKIAGARKAHGLP